MLAIKLGFLTSSQTVVAKLAVPQIISQR